MSTAVLRKVIVTRSYREKASVTFCISAMARAGSELHCPNAVPPPHNRGAI